MSRSSQSDFMARRAVLSSLPKSSLGGGSGTPQRSNINSRLSISSISSNTSTTPKPPPGAPKLPPGSPMPTKWQVGDSVCVEALGVTGTLRFIGATRFKPGIWAGIDLDLEHKGIGKNDGSVGGVKYFECEPENGIFVLATKLSRPQKSSTVVHGFSPMKKTASVNSALRRSSSQQSVTSNDFDRYEPSPAEKRALATGRITAGSRASRYIGVTASQLKLGSIKPPSITSPPTLRSSSPTKKSGLVPLGKGRPSIGPRPSLGRLSGTGLPAPGMMRRRTSTSSQASATSPTKTLRTPSSQQSSRPPSQTDKNISVEKMSNSVLSSKVSNVFKKNENSQPFLSMFDQQTARIDQLMTKIQVLEEDNARLAREKQVLEGEKLKMLEAEKNKVNNEVDEAENKQNKLNLDVLKKSLEEEIANLKAELDQARRAQQTSISAEDHKQVIDELQKKYKSDTENTFQNIIASDKETQQTEIASLKAAHEKELENLRQEINKMEDLEELNEHYNLKISTLQDIINDLQSQLMKLEIQIQNDEGKNENGDHAKRQSQDIDGILSEYRSSEDTSEEVLVLQKQVNEQMADLDSLRETIERIQQERDKEIDEKNQQIHDFNETIEELRNAGKEAIFAYEAKIGDLEGAINQLKMAGQESIQLLEESEKHKSGAVEIHAQMLKYSANLEDQVSALQSELTKAKEHVAEVQASGSVAATDLEKLHGELERAIDLEIQLQDEIEDLQEALNAALKSELSAKEELAVIQAELNEAKKRNMRLERDRPLVNGDNESMVDEVLLKQNHEMQLELSQRLTEIDNMKKILEEINAKNERLKFERLKEREVLVAENEGLKLQMERMKRHSVLSNSIDAESIVTTKRDSLSSTTSTRKEESQQIMGLKHIIQELTKENLEITQQNKLLLEETEELRKAQTALEVNVERLMSDLEGLNGNLTMDNSREFLEDGVGEIESADDITIEEFKHEIRRLQSELVEKQALLDRQLAKHSQEVATLREKLAEVERKATREVNALNKEVAELETLVESKIFKEDELEVQIQELTRELKGYKETTGRNEVYKNGRGTPIITANQNQKEEIATTTISKGVNETTLQELYCELCDKNDHDVLGCTKTWNNTGTTRSADERPFCENCEEEGLHWTEDCPNQDETY